ncbi:hypothetical protein D9C73_014670 [Collichthys lucidus]|uniref:Uncharacterized protein n=1 Tax=Collichthys lucidus TaxID=240159 RepID=A0A4U5UZU9_COLLU|nr:hypothetical protein D9C73_014670 [Collichthys lucidus]
MWSDTSTIDNWLCLSFSDANLFLSCSCSRVLQVIGRKTWPEKLCLIQKIRREKQELESVLEVEEVGAATDISPGEVLEEEEEE